MESPTNEVDNAKIVRSPPKRRRSTFFERRDSVAPHDLTSKDILKDCIEDRMNDQKYLDYLSRYYEDLHKEKLLWKAEVRDRRHRYHDLRKQLNNTSSSNSRKANFSVLTDDDIKFLNGKVNVAKLAESALDLHKSATTSMHMLRRLKDLNTTVLEYCENRVDLVNQYIMDHSFIEDDA